MAFATALVTMLLLGTFDLDRPTRGLITVPDGPPCLVLALVLSKRAAVHRSLVLARSSYCDAGERRRRRLCTRGRSRLPRGGI